MFCKNCGEAMNDNQAICLACGVKTGEGNKYCWNCGNPVNENAEVCLSCGVAVNKANGEYLAGKDKVLIVVLLLLIGGFGVHNFVMGENKKGIAKIILCFAGFLTCGITDIVLGVLLIIELVRILTDKYEVDTNKLF